ncbi:MAG: hemerythrin domain-containing protein [Thermomicrobiales bacterium]
MPPWRKGGSTRRRALADEQRRRCARTTGRSARSARQPCRVVTIHHTIEDQHMFPGLQREQASLAPVLDRLHWEHEVIAEVLDQFDKALVAMMREPERVEDVKRIADELRDALLSHLAYEEDELLEALGRSSLLV